MNQTIDIIDNNSFINIIFKRENDNNSITLQLLEELHEIFNRIEQENRYKVIFLESRGEYFCSGMDFREQVSYPPDSRIDSSRNSSTRFMDLLNRFSILPVVIVSKVQGKVIAGGVGIIACSDYVIATSEASFALSEALWGLIPAMVFPHLIKRVGYQKAYSMCLTTFPVLAQEALDIQLIDELSDNLDKSIQRILYRLLLLDRRVIGEIKTYCNKFYRLDKNLNKEAIEKTVELSGSERIMKNFNKFLNDKKFPWQK